MSITTETLLPSRQERREEKRRKKRKMPQHGRGLAKVYKDAVTKRTKHGSQD